MKFDAKALGVAAGVAAAVVSVTCALIVAVAPQFAMNLFGNVVHLDVTALTGKVTWGNAFGAALFWGLGAGVVFAFGAWVYNRATGKGPA